MLPCFYSYKVFINFLTSISAAELESFLYSDIVNNLELSKRSSASKTILYEVFFPLKADSVGVPIISQSPKVTTSAAPCQTARLILLAFEYPCINV